ncbi:MAG: signal peptidase I [Streptosporangiaceae bacterium]
MNDDQRSDRQIDRPAAGTEDRTSTDDEEQRGRHRQPGAKKGKRGSFLRELPVLIVVAFLLALLIKAFVIQAFYIPSASMENTLRIGDRVLVNKIVYDLRPIHRGDVVVFNGVGSFVPATAAAQPNNAGERLLWAVEGAFGIAPPGQKDFIKRVIGLPGDRVSCCDVHRRVTVNGVPLKERRYLYPGDAPSRRPFNVKVPPGRLWVMGDHRSVSADSRDHMGDRGGGTVPTDEVVGRAFVTYWPPSRATMLSAPPTFYQHALEASQVTASLGGPPPLGAGRRLRSIVMTMFAVSRCAGSR